MYIRIPLLNTLRKSPFDGLTKHAKKVKECIKIWEQAMSAYIEKDYDTFDNLSKKVQKLEHEADLIKGNINAHLPKGIKINVYKSDFMFCLKDQDAIVDFAEDIVIWLEFKKVDMNFIKEDLLALIQKVIETVETLEKAVLEIQLFFSSWKRKKREKMKTLLKQVHRHEWESDRLEKKIAKKIFQSDLDAVDIYFTSKLIRLIADIANRAENAGDRIRAMIAE